MPNILNNGYNTQINQGEYTSGSHSNQYAIDIQGGIYLSMDTKVIAKGYTKTGNGYVNIVRTTSKVQTPIGSFYLIGMLEHCNKKYSIGTIIKAKTKVSPDPKLGHIHLQFSHHEYTGQTNIDNTTNSLYDKNNNPNNRDWRLKGFHEVSIEKLCYKKENQNIIKGYSNTKLPKLEVYMEKEKTEHHYFDLIGEFEPNLNNLQKSKCTLKALQDVKVYKKGTDMCDVAFELKKGAIIQTEIIGYYTRKKDNTTFWRHNMINDANSDKLEFTQYDVPYKKKLKK